MDEMDFESVLRLFKCQTTLFPKMKRTEALESALKMVMKPRNWKEGVYPLELKSDIYSGRADVFKGKLER